MKVLLTIFLFVMLQACSSDMEVTSDNVLGTWKAVGGDDEGVTLALNGDGRYEWTVEEGENQIVFGDSDTMKNNPDGSRTIMGKWSLSDKTLVISMFGDDEKYTIKHLSKTELKLTGYEKINFIR